MGNNRIRPGISFVGANDPERKFFDALFPLPQGTSYNSYLIKGSEKTALIDTVEPSRWQELEANLKGLEKLDYVVSNHAEQDHSGSIPNVLKMFPQAKLVTNAKAKTMLMDLMEIDERRVIVVGEQDTVDLGGKTLKFIIAPWVHWPETMFTHIPEDRILFSCDFFGSHLPRGGEAATDWEDAAKRYFGEIMLPYRAFFKAHLEKVAKMDLEIIAPSHGPLHTDVKKLVEKHRGWSDDKPRKQALIVYASMHGSTDLMVQKLRENLGKQGVEATALDVGRSDLDGLGSALVDAACVVFATPVIANEAHPRMLLAAHTTNILKPKAKIYAIIGSYGWAATAVEQVKNALGNMKSAEMLAPLFVKGIPKEKDYAEIERLAEEIASRIRVME